jgi:hypothetical protein
LLIQKKKLLSCQSSLEKDLCLVGKEVQQSEYKMSSFFALWIYFENQKGNEISPFDLVGNNVVYLANEE